MIQRGILDKNHTYDEIYQVACDILNGNDPFKELYSGSVSQFVSFHKRIAEIFFLENMDMILKAGI